MFIVSVLPLTKTFGKEKLDYFSATDFEKGTVVKVPMRKRDVRALVIESKPATGSRMELRTNQFSLKKIKGSSGKNGGKTFVSEAFMRAVQKFSEYEARTFSSILSTLLPQVLLEAKRISIPTEPKCTLDGDVSAFQGNNEERFASYRSLIRETFARKKSLFLLVPTAEDVKAAEKELSRGIEQFTVAIYGAKKKKEIEKILKVTDDYSHPALIIATPPFLSLLRTDTEILVLDRENSRGYKSMVRPFIDFRIFAKILAHEYCCRLLLGSEILSVDTYKAVREEEINEWGHMKMRETSNAQVNVISMVKTDTAEPFQIFSPELRLEIENTKETRKRIFLFGARRGLSPITVCADCETTVLCKLCGAPVVLYGKEKPYFLCHKCGEKRSAKDECAHCGGWRLITLGIGIEGIEKEIKKMVPDVKLFVLDKDSAPTSAKATKIVEEFLKSPGSILIGTEMALHYLRQEVEVSAVVSADSLLGIPDFRINERLMALFLRIRALGKEKVIFQTRSPENNIFEYAAQGNLLNFFEKEIMERKKFTFPPFSLFVKVAWEGSLSRAEKDKLFIENLFKGLPEQIGAIEIFKVASGTRLNRFHGLIKIDEPSKWPKKEIMEKLVSLPPQFTVTVDPDALL
jgi:primosomal protein N'